MRKFFLVCSVMVATFVFAASGFALERRTARLTADLDGWSSASTCTIQYYNICTGWVWILSGFGPSNVFGVVNDRCPCNGTESLLTTQTLTWTGAPAGYGFTGTMGVFNVDANNCPSGAAIQSQPWLPTGSASYQLVNWNAVVANPKFCLLYTTGPASSNPFGIACEHPAAGPTGPAACGSCYPTSRVNHSFDYGTVSGPLCPPASFFNDGSACDAQIIVAEGLTCQVAVEPQTWGNIKNLYR
jgi:hypothetical protein